MFFLVIAEFSAIVRSAMKNQLILPFLAVALSGAAGAAPYVLPSYQPGALTPADIQPVYSLECLYGISSESSEPDSWGPRLSLNLYSNADDTVRHQFNLNIAGMWGSETYRGAGWSDKVDVFMMPVTAGYNVNLELGRNVFLYLGAKAGYAWADIESRYKDAEGSHTAKDTTGGFTYSFGSGLKYIIADTSYLHVGYEYASTSYDYAGDDDYHRQHVISVGIGCQF